MPDPCDSGCRSAGRANQQTLCHRAVGDLAIPASVYLQAADFDWTAHPDLTHLDEQAAASEVVVLFEAWRESEGSHLSSTVAGSLTDFMLQPWQLFCIILAGWVNREQGDAIEYLRTENQVLKEKLGKKRILLNDDQRRHLAVAGKVLGRQRLAEIGTLFTPDTILRWHRLLVAKKWDLLFVMEVATLPVHFAGCTPTCARVVDEAGGQESDESV